MQDKLFSLIVERLTQEGHDFNTAAKHAHSVLLGLPKKPQKLPLEVMTLHTDFFPNKLIIGGSYARFLESRSVTSHNIFPRSTSYNDIDIFIATDMKRCAIMSIIALVFRDAEFMPVPETSPQERYKMEGLHRVVKFKHGGNNYDIVMVNDKFTKCSDFINWYYGEQASELSQVAVLPVEACNEGTYEIYITDDLKKAASGFKSFTIKETRCTEAHRQKLNTQLKELLQHVKSLAKH